MGREKGGARPWVGARNVLRMRGGGVPKNKASTHDVHNAPSRGEGRAPPGVPPGDTACLLPPHSAASFVVAKSSGNSVSADITG